MNFFVGGHAAVLGIVFFSIILLFLVFDLGFINVKPKETTVRSSALQTLFWILISVAYGLFILFVDEPLVTRDGSQTPHDSAVLFFTTYLLEKALSMDNIFVMLIILQYFNVEKKYYHKILIYGILGAVVFRAIFIFVGANLVQNFEWILYLFGAFLAYSGFKVLFFTSGEMTDPSRNFIYKLCRRYFSLTDNQSNGTFFTRENGALFITPLFLSLVLIETSDVIFAVDSIPAAFSITTDHFIIYTSNICAIMGLRAMFLLLSTVIDKFYLLQKSVGIILIFVGGKMVAEMLRHWDLHMGEIQPLYSFAFIITMIVGAIVLSLIFPKKTEQHGA